MNEDEIKKITFVLFTCLILAVAISTIKIGGLTIRQTPILFVGALIGLLLYIGHEAHEEEGVAIRWLLGAVIAFLEVFLVYENFSLTKNTWLALFFALMLAAPPALLSIRKRLFVSAS